MIREYPAMGACLRYGMVVAIMVGICVFGTGMAVLLGVESRPFWIVVLMGASLLCVALLLLLRELVKLIVDTLVPAP